MNLAQERLKCALDNGHKLVVKKMITDGSVPVRVVFNQSGYTTLFYAIRYQMNDLVLFLLEHGHELNEEGNFDCSRDIEQNTALHAAILYQNEAAFLAYYSKYPHALSLKNKYGQSALHFAARAGLNNVIEQILGSVDIDDTDNDGNTPLHYAASWAKQSTIEYLINQGCKFYMKNNKGFTAVDCSFSHDIANYLQLYAIEVFELTKKDKRRSHYALQDITNFEE
jgi:ankyrin repeat protein